MSATEPKTYRVNEIFYSLQGEGFHAGRPAAFLRFSGCNRSCAFCDTDHGSFELMTAADILEVLSEYPTTYLVVTGGEPLLQLDSELIEALKEAGFFIAVETNGSLPVPEGVDWVTCSPKSRPWAIDRCDELKVVFTSPGDVAEAWAHFRTPHLFVQPLYDASTGTANVGEAVRFVLENPRWRLSLQLHRILGIL